MIKKQWILPVAAASILSAFQAEAQITYSSDDLLLSFRNTSSPTSGSDLEIDVGQISALANVTSTQVLAPAATVTGVFGTPSAGVPIGFSATAADASGTTGTLWLSRADVVTPGVTPTVNLPSQQPFSTQNPVAVNINNIGTGAQGGTTVSAGVTTVLVGSGNSYQNQGQQSASVPQTINFGGRVSIAASKGGAIETIQNGSSGDVYSALWEIPAGTANTTGGDVYLGYLDFKSTGEVDFTPASAVPEPSTYVLLGMTGLAGFAMRRRIRALFA